MFSQIQGRSDVRAPRGRHIDIFPSGFDSFPSDPSGGCHSPSPSRFLSRYHSSDPVHLCHSLLDHYIPERHVEHLIVRTAWYGKQTKRAKHEFILIQVEDKATPGLVNYIVLDRENAEPPPHCPSILVFSRSSVASDAFKIASDGDHVRLIEACKLNPQKLLERLEFPPEQPLHLFELAILAQKVSERHPRYNPIRSNCYLFAGLVWECMRGMNSNATHFSEPGFERERGRIGNLQVRLDPDEVSAIQLEVWEEAAKVEEKFYQLVNQS